MNYTPNDHTFVLCAYKESPYLEDCIQSLLKQTVKSNIIVATSTPCDFISQTAEKYNLPVHVNHGQSGIAEDWNFGYSLVKTPVLTIAHQDDIYCETYVETALKKINTSKHPLIFFSGYSELRNGEVVFHNRLLRIKRFLLSPLSFSPWKGSKFIRRRVLSMGCSICCPAVTYVKPNLPEPVFRSGYSSDLDWQAWEMLSKHKGDFLYVKESLMYHRVHEGSATSEIIGDNKRTQEDFEMFCRFWPKGIARLLTKFYAGSQNSNQL